MAGRPRLKVVDEAAALPAMAERLPAMLALSSLKLCDGNVRRGGKVDLDQLAADILAHGLLQNLTGERDADGVVRIIAGGRRLRAMQLLVKRGAWDADRLVPVIVLEPGDTAREAGLAENFQRLPLSATDEVKAFAAVVAGGASEDDVATRFGVTVRHVRQRLRLAELAPVVFEALAKGKISLDVAQAFCSVPDAERQAKVFGEAGGYALGNASEIRRNMQRAGYAATSPEARYVGRDAYVEHGGTFAVDLFADEDSEHWLNEMLVDRLAGARLVEDAAALRERFGFARAIPRLKHGDADGVTDGLELAAHWGEWTQKPEAERANLVVMVELGSNGEARVSSSAAWLATAGAQVVEIEAPPPSAVRDDDPPPRQGAGEADEPEEAAAKGLSKPLVDALMMRRRDALALAMLDIDAAGEAAALLIFIALEATSPRLSQSHLGTSLGVSYGALAEPVSGVLPWAGDDLDTALQAARAEGLDWRWAELQDVKARWLAFLGLPHEMMERFAAVAVGASLKAWSDANLRRPSPVTMHLGQLLDADKVLRAHWRPTAVNFFDRAGKAACIAFLEECCGAADFPTLAAWRKLKKAELSALCEQLAAGDAAPIVAALQRPGGDHLVRRIVARFKAWLPKEMMFGEVGA